MILRDVMGNELPRFVENTLNVTQKMYDPYSHTGTMNIDFGGADGGREAVYAPCKIIVKKVKPLDYGEVIVWSVDKVKWADGTFDYFSMRLLHCEDVSKLRVGQIIEQGTPFYMEGGMGPKGPSTYGKHIHLGVARGQTTTVVAVASGYHQLANSVEPYRVFFVNDVAMRNSGGYTWVTYVAPAYAPMKDVENMAFNSGAENIWIRSKPSTDYPTVGKLLAGSKVPASQVSTAPCSGYSWVKINYNGVEGYCAVVSGSEVYVVLTPLQIAEAKLAAANAKLATQQALIDKQSQDINALQKEVASFVVSDVAVYTKIEGGK